MACLVKKTMPLLLALTFLTAGTLPKKLSTDDFLPLLREYCKLLSKAYKSGDATVLGKVALDKEVRNVQQTIAGFTGNKVKALATLKNLKIVKVERADQFSYVVLTEEKWDSAFVDTTTGKVKQKESNQPFSMAYHLQRRTGKDAGWMVSWTQYGKDYQKLKASLK